MCLAVVAVCTGVSGCGCDSMHACIRISLRYRHMYNLCTHIHDTYTHVCTYIRISTN